MNPQKNQLSLFGRLCHWAIHESIWTGDADRLRRAKLSLIIPLSLVFFGAPFALLFEFMLHNRLGAVGVVVTCLIASMAPLVLRWTRSVSFTGNYTVFVVFCLLIVNGYICGGIGSAPLTWEVGLPMVAVFLAGRRAGYFWAFACSAILAAFYGAHLLGYESEHGIPKEGLVFFNAAATIALIFVITSVSFLYEVIKDDAFKELRVAQGLLVNSAKMTALGEMAGGVAHEINNPLAIVKINLEMIAEELKEGATERDLGVLERVQVVSLTTDRIASVVQGLRAFSRTGDADPFKKVDVRKVVEDTLQLCREKICRGGVELQVAGKEILMEIECKPVQISQVLMNLLNNSFDMVQGLPRKWIRVDMQDDGRFVKIIVEDSGSGIPEESRDKIFQPFFTTKAIGKGRGLGLSVSKGLVESQHGTVFLDSNSPHTRFVVRLPKLQS